MSDSKETTASDVLDAAIALDRGNPVPAEVIMSALSGGGPRVLSLFWRATGQIDHTVGELCNRLNGPPSLPTLLNLHALMLAEEFEHGK